MELATVEAVIKWSNRHIIHSAHFYSASSSPLLLRGAPATARILYRSFTPKRHKQLHVKDLPKVPTWRLWRDPNPRPFRRKAPNLPMSHRTSHHITFPRLFSKAVSVWLYSARAWP